MFNKPILFKNVMRMLTMCALLFFCIDVNAANYTVSTKADLQTRMAAASPGDTVIVANGSYNWGKIAFTNSNGTNTSAMVVLKAQTFRGVEFTGSTYLQFKGKRITIRDFVFKNGNADDMAVVAFRNNSGNNASYCRLTNIVFDNYNSDDATENEWIGLYGTNNRVDHCTFINKSNPRATIVVWYNDVTYPAEATSTYHHIDSNYFKGRTYMGSNGGETIRVGTSTTSRTNGFNTIESNLFEGCTQAEPEIISNKSDFNTYRYNTFTNCNGGLTLRHGRYAKVYSNFFIRNEDSITQSYGIRIIDKGHKVYNNYFEGMNGNGGGTSQNRAVISLLNGVSTDTTDETYAAQYFPADSCIVAFNTFVNTKGGGAINLGGILGGTIEPKGVVIANNIFKTVNGSVVYQNPSNTNTTYTAEGNIYSAAGGVGLSSSAGFTSAVLNFGTRANGLLTTPAIAQDAAVNTVTYAALLNNIDASGLARSSVFDVGASELNGIGVASFIPLDSNMVGAGKPSNNVLPVKLIAFNAALKNNNVIIKWVVQNEVGLNKYEVEYSQNSIDFNTIGTLQANGSSSYSYAHSFRNSKSFYRLKIIDKDGSYTYSSVIAINKKAELSFSFSPNPASQNIKVIIYGDVKPASTLVLSNNAGAIMNRINATNNNININIKDLPQGLYYLQLNVAGKNISAYPVMITR